VYTAIIVDDEPMALEAIKMAADWEEYGFTIAGECSNGEEALHLSHQVRPDLIIADIRMPDMDGLELATRVLNEVDCDPVFILVSGYDEFKYAKRALQIGIRYYILKPVIEEDFSAVLLEVLDELERKAELKKIAAESTETIVDMFFENLLTDRLNGNELDDLLPPGLLPYKHAYWSYAALYVTHRDTGYDDFQKALKAYNQVDVRFYSVFLDTYLFGVILCSRQHEMRQWLHLEQTLRDLFGKNYYLAVGNPVHDLAELPASMAEAETALEYRFFHHPGSILYYWEIKNQTLNYSFRGIYYMEQFVDALKSLDQDRIAASITKMFDAFRRTYMAPEIVKMYCINILYKSFAMISEMGGIPDKVPFSDDMNFLGGNPTLGEIEKILREYAKHFCRYAQSLKANESPSMQQKVEDYIRAHYKRSLTIKEIARKLYIHPSYLGTQIHKWFGCGFTEYLHNMRMKEAAQLILHTDLRIHEIASGLGYTSYNSFLEQFVRFYSMKPTEYRRKIKK
jgi:two-component system response regulator YesN